MRVPSARPRRRVLIAGGGVTGLTVAYRLLRRAAAGADPPVEVTVLESRARLGGNVRTEHLDSFIIEGGPDSFVITKPEAAALCRELGLGHRLIPTQPRNRRVYMLHRGKLLTLPEGLMLTVPTEVRPILETPLFSWPCKARMALDLLLPRADVEDESLGAFVRRRLGQEALEQLAEPLLGGIYAGNVETLSLKATFPQLAEYEKRAGSLIRGAWSARRDAKTRAAHIAAERGIGEGRPPPPSPFLSLKGGMGELIDALHTEVASHSSVRLGVGLEGVEHLADGSYRLRCSTSDGAGLTLEADDVVFATPAYVAARALGTMAPELSEFLAATPYVSTGTISLGYQRSQIPHALDAVGVLLPRREGRRILAATFSSSKWEGRAASDQALVRVFVGGHRDPDVLTLSDEALVELARLELQHLLDVQGEPLFARVFRYEKANPQPIVGHLARVNRLRALAPRGLHFAGAAFDGVGIPDCIRQAEAVASAILTR